MKKFLAILLAGLMILICFVGCSKKNENNDDDGDATLTVADEQVYNGFEYDTNEEGNYSIIGYRIESEEPVEIPTEIGGRPVTGIEAGAFKANKMSAITIPDSITYIGNTAFYDCDNLTSVVIPDSVVTIGKNTFDNCAKLTSVTLPAGLTELESGMFMNCIALTSVTLPETVTAIGDGAFYGCSALTSVILPEGLTELGNSVFYRCSALKSLTLPSTLTVENIGEALIASEAVTVLNVKAGSGAEAYAIANNLKYVAS